MMEEMNKWLSAHKKLCVITGIFGLLVSPFLWPIFLAVIIQSLVFKGQCLGWCGLRAY